MVRARTHALVSGPQWATEVDKSGAGGAGLLEKKAYSASDEKVACEAWARAKEARAMQDVAVRVSSAQLRTLACSPFLVAMSLLLNTAAVVA